MRKIVLVISSLISMFAAAQDPYKVYAELLGFEKGIFSKKVTVQIDFGQEVSFWKQGDMKIVSEDGKDIVFNSMVDALNFMSKNGWEFVQAYVVTDSNQKVYHWLMSKEVTNETQIKEGFYVKSETSQKQEKVYTVTYFRKAKKSSKWDEVKVESFPDIPYDDIITLMNEWKNQQSEMYDFDCKVSKIK